MAFFDRSSRKADRHILTTPPRSGVLMAATILLVTLCLVGPIMSYSGLPGTGEGSPARQAGYFLVFALTLFGINPITDMRRILVVPITIVIALAWCWLSASWSLSTGATLRRIFLTSIVIWSVFAIVKHGGYERPVTIIRVLLVILLVVNLLASIFVPDIGIHQFNEPGDKNLIGDWRGVLVHKNFAAPTAVFAALFFLFDAKRIPIAIRVVVIAMACFFLMHSGSKTSVGIGIFAAILGSVFQYYRGSYRSIIILLLGIAGIAVAITAYIYVDPLKGSFTDARAFTGRPLIWKALVDFWQTRPLTGSGYGAFWNIGGNEPIFHYATGWVTQITIGHNGFLDMLAQVGAPGLALIVVSVIIVPTYKILTAPDGLPGRLALSLSILYFCIGHNATESSLFERDAIPQVFMMFAIAFARLNWSQSLSAPRFQSAKMHMA